MKIMTSWDDLGKSLQTLQRDQCYHADPLKNWDLAQIGDFCEGLSKSDRILDAGCSESHCSVLRYLHRKGFRELVGMDLQLSLDDRIEQLLLMKQVMTVRPPFRLIKGDITRTKFSGSSFGAVVCLSVIEHGVDLRAFMREMRRLLKPGGMLYISTDYWPDKINSTAVQAWGLPWSIFSRDEIGAIVGIAGEEGMAIENPEIPEVGQPIVKWSGKEYTFLSMVFTRR